MSKDLSMGGVQAELEKDTKSLCATKHIVSMLVEGGATIIRPYKQEDGYTKEMIDNFAKRGITHQKKGILTAGHTKLRVRFSPYDTVGWDVTDYHQGDALFHKIRIRLYCDGKLVQERDMSGPVDGGATQEVFLLTKNGKWTVEADPISAGECATPNKKSDIAFVNLEPVPQGWEIEKSMLDDDGEDEITFTNELKPLATVGLIGLGALVLTRLMKRRRSSKEAEESRSERKKRQRENVEMPTIEMQDYVKVGAMNYLLIQWKLPKQYVCEELNYLYTITSLSPHESALITKGSYDFFKSQAKEIDGEIPNSLKNKASQYMQKFMLIQKNTYPIEFWYESSTYLNKKMGEGYKAIQSPSKMKRTLAFNVFKEMADGNIRRIECTFPSKKGKVKESLLKRNPVKSNKTASGIKTNYYKLPDGMYRDYGIMDKRFTDGEATREEVIEYINGVYFAGIINQYINEYTTQKFWDEVIDKFNIKFTKTYNPYEKMLRRRLGLSAEERKKGFIPFEELEVGDVFVFKTDKEDKTWERFVLKSKEVDNIDIDDETGEWVDIYHFVIDPYKPSPVSDINGTARGDTIVFRWTNPYEEMILKRRQGTKKEAENEKPKKEEKVTMKKTGDNVWNLEYKGHKGRMMKVKLQGDKPYYSLSAYIDLTPFQTERIEIGRLMPKVEEGEDGLLKELSWNNSDVYGSRGNATTLKEGKKRFKGFIDKLEHGEKFMSPKGTWLNKKNISQDDSTKKLMAYDELLIGEQNYGMGNKREMRYSPETLENNIGRIISQEDAQSFKPRPPLLNPYEVMLKRRMGMGAETFEAKTANYILFMDFLEEAFYDKDSEVYKARQELYPDDKKSEITIYKLYRLYCFYIYYDRIPQRIKDERTINGQITWVRGRMNMGGVWNKHHSEGYLTDDQFKNAIRKARRKYCKKFDGDYCDWMNYNGKIYHVSLRYKIGFSTLKNQYTKKLFKRLPMDEQRKIMKGN